MNEENDSSESGRKNMKTIQPRSEKRRRERQFDLIVKRARNWYEDSHAPPNFALFYLRKDEIMLEGPPHMAEFLNDPVVITRFKEVALQRTVNLRSVTDPDTSSSTSLPSTVQDPIELPYGDPEQYTWDSMVFLLPALLAREGIKGKYAYCPGNRPSWWPEDVRFCSPNSSTTESKRLNVQEMRRVIASFLENRKNTYTIVDLEDMEEDMEVEEAGVEVEEAEEPDLRSLWTKRAIPSKENFLIASCEGVRLSAEAFLSLRDRVSDELLDAYMYCCLRAKKSRYEYINCAVLSMLLSKRNQEAIVDYEISSPLLMGFYNIGRRHWVLIMISCIEKRLTVLDPLGESKMTMQCILSTWKNFLRISKKNTSLSCGNWYVNTIPHTKQQDSSSCGIFCLMFVEKLLEEEALFFNTCSDAITAFRVKVASRIIENQDDETLHSLCRICQKTDSMKGKLRYIDWVGCDDCGLFWCHFSCMKMSSSYHDFIQQKWSCCVCSS